MKELAPHPSEQDIYLMSIVDELRKKYVDVEVLRGQWKITFVYFENGEKKSVKIDRATIEDCQANNEVPGEIRRLL